MNTGTEESADSRLHKALRRCGHVLYHQRHHCQQDEVLQQLAAGGPMNQQQIQERLSIKPGSASELISKLEGKGMLARTRDSADRRRVVLTLTEKGRSFAELSGAEKSDSDLFACLSEEEKKTLTALLRKLLTDWGLEEAGA